MIHSRDSMATRLARDAGFHGWVSAQFPAAPEPPCSQMDSAAAEGRWAFEGFTCLTPRTSGPTQSCVLVCALCACVCVRRPTHVLCVQVYMCTHVYVPVHVCPCACVCTRVRMCASVHMGAVCVYTHVRV